MFPPPGDGPVSTAVKDALYLDTLQDADRAGNLMDAMRLQVMLGGFEAMLLDEEEQTGTRPGPDDAAVRGFFLHQGIVLRTTRQAAEARVAAARLLRDTLPGTWAVFLQGLATERCVTVAAEEAEGLAAELRPVYDERAAVLVQTERPSVLERRLSALRDELDPDGAAERHRRANERRHLRARVDRDGGATLTIRSTATDIAAVMDKARRDAVAAHGRDGECRTLGQLMVDSLIDAVLTTPDRDTSAQASPSYPLERLGSGDRPERKTIAATILVTMSAETATGASDGPATVAGFGTIDADTARHLVAHTATWTRAVIDPVDDTVTAIDTHARYIPAGLKKLIHLRMPTCVGDDCGLPAHRTDLDHAIRYEHDGRTRHDNLSPMCRRSHQMKDEGFLGFHLDPDGTPVLTTKWGATRRAPVAFTMKPAAPRREYPDHPPF